MALPGKAARHMINRFSYGYTAGLQRAVANAGGPEQWFESQLRPSKVADTKANAMKAWYPYLRSSAKVRRAADHAGKRPSWEQSMDLVRWTILRRITSKRQLHETMVDFWSNLLHVPAFDDGWMFRVSYDSMIRKYALTTFSDLLVHATLHPSLGLFLNSVNSTKDDTNENHGRELLELHTVGLGAGYTEAMVKDSARILTGYHIEPWQSTKRTYRPGDHYVGPVNVLGFHDANADPDGRAVAKRYLRYLAKHPATAKRIATRLAQRFVSDNPSSDLVAAAAHAYTTSGTSIKATLRAIIHHPDFAASVDGLVRTPSQDAVATYRALGVVPRKPRKGDYFGVAVPYVLGDMGESPFGWPAPNGFPEVSAAWASVGRMRSSWDMHFFTAGGYWPSKGVSRLKPHLYLPAGAVRLDEAVDYLSRRLLGRPGTEACVTAATQLTELKASDVVKRATFGDWRAVQLITTVLNSPEHLRK